MNTASVAMMSQRSERANASISARTRRAASHDTPATTTTASSTDQRELGITVVKAASHATNATSSSDSGLDSA